jgi:putative aminopeptidase FrvX
MKQYITISDMLEKYSAIEGVSGFETKVAEEMQKDLPGLVYHTDSMGNAIFKREGEPGYPVVMLDAHMDSPGLMVRFISPNGFIYFVCVGGLWGPTVLGQVVRVNGYVGIIGSKAPHVMSAAERNSPVDTDNLFIDLGVTSKEEVEAMGIEVGTPIVFESKYRRLQGDLVSGPCFDDRAGIVMIIEALKRTTYKGTIYIVGSTQEEVGLKGSKTAAFQINPDYAICADTTIPCDHPGGDPISCPVVTGKGPVVVVADGAGRGIIATPKFVKAIRDAAKVNKIPMQLEVGDGGTTNASMIHLQNKGIPTAVISVATRYIHSPTEVLNLGDIDKAAELIARTLESLKE